MAEAKAHLRVDGTDEDTLIASLILTSRLHVETALGLALITQSWRLLLDRWPLHEGSGAAAAAAADDRRGARARRRRRAGGIDRRELSRRCGERAAAARAHRRASGRSPGQAANGIEIDFTAGYGDAADDVPAPIRQALLLLIAHWYEHREPIEVGSPETVVPPVVSDLLAALPREAAMTRRRRSASCARGSRSKRRAAPATAAAAPSVDLGDGGRGVGGGAPA